MKKYNIKVLCMLIFFIRKFIRVRNYMMIYIQILEISYLKIRLNIFKMCSLLCITKKLCIIKPFTNCQSTMDRHYITQQQMKEYNIKVICMLIFFIQKFNRVRNYMVIYI